MLTNCVIFSAFKHTDPLAVRGRSTLKYGEVNGVQVVFTLRHSRHVGGRKQKISNQLLLFFHQQLYIAALLSVSLEIGCKPSIVNCQSMRLQITWRSFESLNQVLVLLQKVLVPLISGQKQKKTFARKFLKGMFVYPQDGCNFFVQVHQQEVYANRSSTAARTSTENVTSRVCNHFLIFQSHYTCKMCSNYSGIKLEPALHR